MNIYYHDLPDFETYPPKGISSYEDSKVFEGDFIKNEKEYTIKFRLVISYSRWFCGETLSGPCEDECTIKSFDVQLISGTDDDGKISEKKLDKLLTLVKEQLNFI